MDSIFVIMALYLITGILTVVYFMIIIDGDKISTAGEMREFLERYGHLKWYTILYLLWPLGIIGIIIGLIDGHMSK